MVQLLLELLNCFVCWKDRVVWARSAKTFSSSLEISANSSTRRFEREQNEHIYWYLRAGRHAKQENFSTEEEADIIMITDVFTSVSYWEKWWEMITKEETDPLWPLTHLRRLFLENSGGKWRTRSEIELNSSECLSCSFALLHNKRCGVCTQLSCRIVSYIILLHPWYYGDCGCGIDEYSAWRLVIWHVYSVCVSIFLWLREPKPAFFLAAQFWCKVQASTSQKAVRVSLHVFSVWKVNAQTCKREAKNCVNYWLQMDLSWRDFFGGVNSFWLDFFGWFFFVCNAKKEKIPDQEGQGS